MTVSIHAPRVGRDAAARGKISSPWSFQSTRPVWGATQGTGDGVVVTKFQSTRPVWGATGTRLSYHRDYWSFNPRAPCGARP